MQIRTLALVLALALGSSCRYSYMLTTPVVLEPCPTSHIEEPRATAATALVTALTANGWTILYVAPDATAVDANACLPGGKACTTIEARVNEDGSIDVFRREPSATLARGHYRALARGMQVLKRRHRSLRCHQRPRAE